MRRNVRISVNGTKVTDLYTDGAGQQLNTHLPSQCRFRYCVIHHPMPGPWSTWATFWRGDISMMERVCYHRKGHPAAEEYLFHSRHLLQQHDCCGCPCTPSAEQIRAAREGSWIFDGEVVENRLELPSAPDRS